MKKGFTLIELIMVILLLGVIALITVPAVNQVIKKSRIDTYDKQIETIENTARTYMANHSTELPNTNSSKYVCVTVEKLKKEGLLSNKDIINPNYKKESTKREEQYETFNGSVKVTWVSPKYVYTYFDSQDCS